MVPGYNTVLQTTWYIFCRVSGKTKTKFIPLSLFLVCGIFIFREATR